MRKKLVEGEGKMKNACKKAVCFVLVFVLSWGFLSYGSFVGAEQYNCYETKGFEPALPVSGSVVDISSVDYYYEDKDDSLPGLHGGLDIVVGNGTAVLSVADGEVTYVGTNSGYGKNIIVKHTVNKEIFYSRYAHLSSYSVSKGEHVSVGQTIAKSGNSGTYAYHLHLEIYENDSPAVLERAYTLKFYLGQGTEILSRFRFYEQFISGEYNSQNRVNTLGGGGSCYSRCGRSDAHNHISVFANYIRKLYIKSGRYYIYNSSAEASLFACPNVKAKIYESYDTNKDAHLSFCEVMSVSTLDLKGVSISSLNGTEIFENASEVLTQGEIKPVYTLKVRYSIPREYLPEAGKCGTWKHTDTESKLRIRSGPSLSYSHAGWIDTDTIIVITDTKTADGYLWGKTVYNGISGWCALDPSWSEQLSSTVLDFYMGSDGYLHKTATTEIIEQTFLSTDSTSELFSLYDFSFLEKDKMLVGWKVGQNGETVRVSEEILLSELCTASSEGNIEATLYAVIADSNIKGDSNADGVLDQGDIDTLVRYISGYTDQGVREDLLDYNGDGKINNRDIIAIRSVCQIEN